MCLFLIAHFLLVPNYSPVSLFLMIVVNNGIRLQSNNIKWFILYLITFIILYYIVLLCLHIIN